MRGLLTSVVLALALSASWRAGFPSPLFAQAEYRVYAEHPRLFLDESRLKRIRRDVERQTLRWNRLARLLEAPDQLVEPGFAMALAYQASGARPIGEAAVAWAVRRSAQGFSAPGAARQGALVYDWCYELFDEESRGLVAAALGRSADEAIEKPGDKLSAVRDGVLIAIATAGDWAGSEAALGAFLERQWKGDILPLLRSGELIDSNADLVALLEISHAIRPNLEQDLWRDAPAAFQTLPLARILAASGRTFETPEGLVREPWRPEPPAADRRERDAVMARIADLLLVAYDGGSRPFQFLQGWLRNDRLTLTGPLGAPYEFLWLNPYLPGLAPDSGPLIAFDPVRGRLFARQSWSPDALRLFAAGGQVTLDAGEGPMEIRPSDRQPPLELAGATILFPDVPDKFKTAVRPAPNQGIAELYFVGLEPKGEYQVRVGKSDWLSYVAGPGGVLRVRSDPRRRLIDELDYDADLKVQIRAAK